MYRNLVSLACSHGHEQFTPTRLAPFFLIGANSTGALLMSILHVGSIISVTPQPTAPISHVILHAKKGGGTRDLQPTMVLVGLQYKMRIRLPYYLPPAFFISCFFHCSSEIISDRTEEDRNAPAPSLQFEMLRRCS